ncbi:MAG: ribonuclease P protein component [Thermoanaerobaculia bacterium]
MLPAGDPQNRLNSQISQSPLSSPSSRPPEDLPGSRAPQERSERFRRSQTLRKTDDYRRCYAQGRRKGGAFLVLHSVNNPLGEPRFGQTASRKVGNSVERHRLRRWGREIFRRWPERHRLPANDLIAHFKPGAAAANFADFRRELERLLASLLVKS